MPRPNTFNILLLGTILFAASAGAQVTVLTRATVVDGTGAAAQKDITIVMEKGRIREMDRRRKFRPPPGPPF